MIQLGKYPAYKDSGVEWLGEIPAGWEVKKLKHLVERISNGTTTEQLQYVEEKDPTVVPVTRIETISNESVDFNKVGWVKYKPILKSFKLNKGDILFSHINSLEMVGKTAIYLENKALYSGMNLLRISPKPTINCYWFHYYLKSNASRQYFTSRAKPSINQASLPSATVYNYYVVTPSTKEQTAIATFLDEKTTKIDTAIAQKEQMISLLKERKQILIQNAVTKGINPDAKMKDSGVEWIGEIPEGWEIKSIKHLGRIINGFAFDSSKFRDSGVRVMKIANIQTMEIDWTDESFIDFKYYEQYPQFRIMKGDLVFALTRPIISTGIKAAIVENDEKILLNQRNAVLKPYKSLNKMWIYFVILASGFSQAFSKEIDKTGQQPNISTYSIGNLKISFPSLLEQAAIVDFIETQSAKIDTSISLQQQQITKLKEYKSTLIDSAVTGKIKVG